MVGNKIRDDWRGVLREMNPNTIPYPSKLNLPYPEWREGQVKAILWLIKDGWLDGYPFDLAQTNREVKVLEAPTGTGKTGLILGLAALHPELRFLILCATKAEQEQYENNVTSKSDFISLIGRGNFHCLDVDLPDSLSFHLGDFIVCQTPDCKEVHADEAHCVLDKQPRECPEYMGCGYYSQLRSAVNSQVVVTNYAYGLAMLKYAKNNIGNFDVIVSDEGHILDQMLENFIQLELRGSDYKMFFGDRLPYFVDGGSVDQWKNWGLDNLDDVEELQGEVEGVDPDKASPRELRETNRKQRCLDTVTSISSLDDNWVVEEKKERNGFVSGYTFKPVWVTNDSDTVLFKHAKRHIIMSGTIPSVIELGKKVGLRKDEMEFHRLPYTFPVENRRIYIRPNVNLTMKHKEENLPRLVEEVDNLIQKYFFLRDVGEIEIKKALIHTVSYQIAQYLLNNSGFRRFMVSHTTADRIRVLEDFKQFQGNQILVSPSMDKAIDLPGDQCELIIVTKLPYPYLGSKVMQARLKKSRTYYTHETLMTLIQMAGRGVRSETDICPTYVLDAGAVKFLKQAKGMIPKAIKEAIVYE